MTITNRMCCAVGISFMTPPQDGINPILIVKELIYNGIHLWRFFNLLGVMLKAIDINKSTNSPRPILLLVGVFLAKNDKEEILDDISLSCYIRLANLSY
jgi:hypothetical protein